MNSIIHLIYRYDIGGLEQVMTDCISGLQDGYQHTVISLTTVSDQAEATIAGKAEVIALHKKEGNDPSLYRKLFTLFRSIKPTVVQTYNLPTLEYQLIAFLARVPLRIHAEHGRDASDPNGSNKKYNLLRRLLNPFIHRWVAVSADLQRWLVEDVGISNTKVQLIYNGIDSDKFTPATEPAKVRLDGFAKQDDFIIATIGRLDPVKNQQILLDVAEQLLQQQPQANIIMAIIGDGPLRQQLQQQIEARSLQQQVWLPGARYDIAQLLQQIDLFILPSIAEGVPMTLLEAMSSGKAVVASDVGGIAEVITGECGYLIHPQDRNGICSAISTYLQQPQTAVTHGINGRERILSHFSRDKMVSDYQQLYR